MQEQAEDQIKEQKSQDLEDETTTVEPQKQEIESENKPESIEKKVDEVRHVEEKKENALPQNAPKKGQRRSLFPTLIPQSFSRRSSSIELRLG